MLIPLFGLFLLPISTIFFIGNYYWLVYFLIIFIFFIGLYMLSMMSFCINNYISNDEDDEMPKQFFICFNIET